MNKSNRRTPLSAVAEAVHGPMSMVCIGLLLAAVSTPADGALLQDPSFEASKTDTPWRIDFVRAENEQNTRVDFVGDLQSYIGQRSLQVESVGQGAGYVLVSQQIRFEKPYPTTLYVCGAVNADVDGYTKLYAHARVEGEDEAVHLTNATSFEQTDGFWRREYAEWSSDERPIEHLRFMVIFSGKGSALWDDLALTTDKPARPPLQEETPWLTVPQIDSTPTTSEDWDAAAILGNFTLLGQNSFADAQTRVRMAHTSDTLHVRAECAEPFLDPVRNAPTAFKAAETGRDATVFRDDCIELFFDADGTRSAFTHLAVNALATKWDADEGDTSWNGNWSATAGTDTSQWWCELSIPLEEIGLSGAPEKAGTFNVARERKPVEELSSYSPLSSQFAEPIHFASLRLGPSAPNVDVTWKSTGETLNGVEYDLYNPTAHVANLVCGLAQDDNRGNLRELLEHVDLNPGETKTVSLQILRAEESNWVRSRGFVRTRSDARYLRITPWFQTTPSGIMATLTIEATADFAAIYNGHPLNLEQSGEDEWRERIRIHEGSNALGIELKEAGRWRCRIWDETTALNIVSGAGWMTPETEPDASWTTKTFRPGAGSGNWVHVDPVSGPAEDDQWRGARWIEGAASSRFLRQIRYGMTRYMPEQDAVRHYPFYEDYGQIAKVYTLNPGPHVLADYEMIVETPPAVTLDNPVGRVNYKQRGFFPTKMTRERLSDGWERNTISFSRYLWPHGDVDSLANDMSAITKHGLPLLLRPAGEGKAAVRVYGEAYEGFITEVPRLVEYDRQPFPEGERVPGFELYLWGNPFFDHPQSSWPHLLDMHEAAGITTYILGHLGTGDPMVTPPKYWRSSENHHGGYEQMKRFVSYARSRGFRIAANIFWPIDQRQWLEEHPEDGAIYAGSDGERHASRVPMRLLLDKQHPVYEKWREKLSFCLRDMTLDEVLWDWEASPFMGSYDEGTLADFRKYADLPADRDLDEHNIQQSETLRKAWIDFRCDQVVQVASLMREIVKDVSPETKLSFYSGYPPYSREKYTADWKGLTGVVDVAMAGYHGIWNGNARTLSEIMAAEGKPSIPGLAVYAKSHRAEMLGVKLSQALIEGGRGAMIFACSSNNMNATGYASIGRVSRLLPQIEPFLRNLDRQDQLVEANAPAAVLQNGERYLLLLQNRSNKAIECDIEWSGPQVQSFRILGEKSTEPQIPDILTLQPFSAAWALLDCGL